ncbi:hypothetical protein QBC34DRAFT_497315 [Podospora aff. communis PSN243]|uniref:Uncharacterized protein n=1 Tax=Podospora aff. communis PSN243 TaxID=3040156 RepID=A0AAV9GCZ0_9PEZI|nr:hypothetical protein QBC34DRAFT_497315 [Podospora aff. communis PSN243]
MSEFRGSSSAQPDYSGLEVVPAGTAPEVVSASTAPEVDDSRSPAETLVEHHLYKLSVQAPLEPWRGADDAPQVRVVEKANDEISAPAPTPTPQPWWRRKVWIIALVAAVLVTVGVVVGVVVATRRADNPTPSNTTTPQPEDQPPSPPNTTRHPCDLTICPQILASALLNTWTSSPTLLLFARSATNNTLTYTTTTTTNLSLSPIFHPWQPLDLGAPLLSQPTALTWSNGTRASVFALSSPDHMVHTLKFTSISPSQQIQPPTQWQPLGGPSDSLIATCSPNGTRPDLWTTADREITHNFGIGPAFDAGWSVPSDSSWPRDVSFKTPLQRTRPGVLR